MTRGYVIAKKFDGRFGNVQFFRGRSVWGQWSPDFGTAIQCKNIQNANQIVNKNGLLGCSVLYFDSDDSVNILHG